MQVHSVPGATPTDESHDMVAKEDVNRLHFAPDDVLPEGMPRRRRALDIERACMLGNNDHVKVLIFFQTADGQTHRTDTTIWACDSQHVSLKAGASLPVRAISGIEFL